MQFQVPQFIEVEDKIFGPLTFKQFIFLAGGAGTCYLLWRVLPLLIAAPLMGLVGGLALALAFFEYNGRPFLHALETMFYFAVRSKLYLWSNQKRKAEPKKLATAALGPQVYIPHLSESKLHTLAWSLDIKERLSAGVGSEDDRTQRNVLEPIRTSSEALGRPGAIE